MKIGMLMLVALSVILLTGCSGREEELEKEKAKLQAAADSLSNVIEQRDTYFDGVVRAINDVYKGLEVAREKEAKIRQETGEAEGKFSLTNDKARADLLDEIAGIDSSLVVHRKKINSLQARIRSLNREFKGLNETIDNLKRMLEERETTIAMLEVRVSGLEGDVVEKARLIAVRDSIIDSQVNMMNKVFYIAGSREQLEEKGIIRDEGGFPFGWLGSTTVLSGGVDEGYFNALDMSKDDVISVDGTIDEIVPPRPSNLYAMNPVGEKETDFRITDPEGFWKERFLVIITE